MASDPKLVVALEARVRDFERQLSNAQKNANRNFTRIEKDGKRMSATLERDIGGAATRVGGILRSFGAGFAGGIFAGGAAGLVSQIGQVAKGIATIGDEAARAGLSSKAFQELRYVAEQNRVGVDSLVDGIKELNLRADEWIQTGSGPAAEAFQRLGYSAAELKEKLKDPSALFSEIIGKLGQLDKAAQIRIADEVFGGTGGEKFVQLIEQGEAGLKRTVEEARNLGLVIDDELIAKADEIDRKFTALTTTVGTGLKRAIVEAAAALGDFIDRFNTLSDQNARNQAAELSRLGQRRLEIDNELTDLRRRKANGDYTMGDGWFGTSIGASDVEERIRDLENEAAAIAASERAILGATAAREAENAAIAGRPSPNVPFNTLPATDMNRQVQLQVARQRIKALESAGSGGYRALGPITESGDRAYGAYQMMGANIGPWSQKALGTRLTPDQFLNNPAFQDAIFDKIFGEYIDKFGMEGAAQAWFGGPGAVGQTGRTDMLGTSVGAYGSKFVAGLKDEWEGLREVTDATATSTAQVAREYDAFGQIATTALDGLANALADGKLEGRELLQILANVAKQLLTMPAQPGGGGTPLGGIAGIIGSIFGFADGGIAAHGKPVPLRRFANGGVSRSAAIFGEAGPEAAVPLPDGRSIPVNLRMPTPGAIPQAQASASQQAQAVTIAVRVDGANGDDHVRELVAQGVRAGIGEYDKALNNTFGQRLQRAQQRQM